MYNYYEQQHLLAAFAPFISALACHFRLHVHTSRNNYQVIFVFGQAIQFPFDRFSPAYSGYSYVYL